MISRTSQPSFGLLWLPEHLLGRRLYSETQETTMSVPPVATASVSISLNRSIYLLLIGIQHPTAASVSGCSKQNLGLFLTSSYSCKCSLREGKQHVRVTHGALFGVQPRHLDISSSHRHPGPNASKDNSHQCKTNAKPNERKIKDIHTFP